MADLPRHLGKYHVLELLGRGPRAEIYKVKTVGVAGFEKLQALLRVLPPLALSPRFAAAFIEEAKLAATLNYPNVEQIYDFGHIEGELVLATEHVDGVTLGAALERARARKLPPPLPLAVHVASEAAQALDYAHRKADHRGRPLGILHCDVSPENVLLTLDGLVKVRSFGVARALWMAVAASPAERLELLTPYRSPEQVPGLAIDARSDLFAFGAVVWELLAGRPLFAAASADEVADAILHRPVPPPSRLQPEVPAALDALVLRLLERDPSRRWPSASELLSELAAIEHGIGRPAGGRALLRWLGDLFPELNIPEAPTPLPIRRRRQAGDALATVSATDRHEATVAAKKSASDRTPTAIPRPSARATGRRALPAPPSSTAEAQGSSAPRESSTLGPPAPGEGSASGESSGPREPSVAIDPPALGEKKRIVVAALHLETAPELHRDARRLLADMVYKAGALLHRPKRPGDASGEQDGGPHEADDSRPGGLPRDGRPESGPLLALFGLPQASEDGVAQAIRLARDAIEAVAELGRALRQRDANRAAPVLAAGLCEGTARWRSEPQAGYTLLGEAADEAIVLSQLARPGQVLLGGTPTRLASRQYLFAELSPLKRRGRSLRPLLVLGLRPLHDLRNHPPADAFVGREPERALLLDTWHQVEAGGFRIVALVGDAGVGKSRLVAELLSRDAPDAPLVAAAAAPDTVDAPYALVTDLLASATGFARPPASEAEVGAIVELLRSTMARAGIDAIDADEAAGTFRQLLRLRILRGTGTGETGVVARMAAPESMRERAVAALGLLLDALDGSRAPVLFLEDVHWADRPSAEVLARILQKQSRRRALVLLTYRPLEPNHPLPPAGSLVLELKELGGQERDRLIADRLGAAALGVEQNELVARVASRAGGNPLFIEAVAQALQDSHGKPDDIPETIAAVLLARVDRLPPAAKAAAQLAAVCGPSFRVGVLRALLGATTDAALAALVDSGLVASPPPEEDSAAIAPEDRELRFRHILLQEALYDAISAIDRRTAHRRIGELLARRHAEGRTEAPGAIARHLEEGGEPGRAASSYLTAGRIALAACSCSEARRAFEKARDLADAGELRYQALAGHEQACFQLGSLDDCAADQEQMLALVGDDALRRADVHNREAARLLRGGDSAAALAAVEKAERAATGLTGRRADLALAETLRLRADACDRRSDFAPAESAARRSLDLVRRAGSAPEELRALASLGRIYMGMGRLDRALEYYTPALELIRKTADAWTERIVRNHLACIHVGRGDLSRAMRNAERALSICRRYADRAREGDNTSVVGEVLFFLGQYRDAWSRLEAAIAIHEETRSRWSKADTLVYFGECAAALGDPGRGLAILEEAARLAQELEAGYVMAEGRNAIAHVLLARGGPGDAERAAEEAERGVAIAERANTMSFRIQGLARRAQALARLADPAAAQACSTDAVALLDRHGSGESSPEEVLYTHFRVLAQRGDPSAGAFLERAHRSLEQKAALIDDAAWRRSFTREVRLHAAILRDAQASSQLPRR